MLIADKSPPNAPKAQPMDWNLAEPTVLSIEILMKSFKLWELTIDGNKNKKSIIFLITLYYLSLSS